MMMKYVQDEACKARMTSEQQQNSYQPMDKKYHSVYQAFLGGLTFCRKG